MTDLLASLRLPALRERGLLGPSRDLAMRWSFVALFVAGALISLATLPLSGYTTAGEAWGEVGACAVALATALAVAGWGDRVPAGAYPLLLVVGTACISVGLWAVGRGPVDGEMFYVWIALYSAFFFTRAQAVGELAVVGAAYAVVLVARGGGNGEMRWLVTMGVLAMTALIFGWIKETLDRQLAEGERSERELETSLSLQRATLEATGDGLLVVDNGGRIISSNRRFQEMWKLSDEALASGDRNRVLGVVLGQLVDPEQFLQRLDQLRDRPDAETRDVIEFKDGRIFEREARPQRGLDGTIHGRVWSFRDVTERERTQARLRELADRDPLTRLLNRRRFEEEVADRVRQAARYGSGGALLLLDLDNFKHVNDSLGHRTGDAVLRSVATLLRGRLRETDVLARLGGDEFAVLLPHADDEAATSLAEDLLETIRRHRAVFAGRRLRLTTSIGIAAIRGPRAQTADELMVEADVAMYEAKEAGRDGAAVYQAPDAAPLHEEASLSWSDRIRAAMAEDRLTLYSQPIVDLHSGRVSQHELLLRMQAQGGKLLPPNSFLPSAERSGLIEDIDEWVTRQAIVLIHRHGQAGRDLRLEVNLSGRTIGSPRLPRTIAAQLAETPIEPERLIFEVAETAAVVNMDEAREFADALSRLGCRFALDDFGAGFGSFYYLKHLPLQYLKIDGDFIANMGRNATDQAVVKAIVELARQLRMATIAEFVGDPRTVELLREYGVDYVQGYHVGRPRPVARLFSDDVAVTS